MPSSSTTRQRPDPERYRERQFRSMSEAELIEWFHEAPAFADFLFRDRENRRMLAAHRKKYAAMYSDPAARARFELRFDDDLDDGGPGADDPVADAGRLAYLASSVEGMVSIVRGLDIVSTGVLRVALWFEGALADRTIAQQNLPGVTTTELDLAAQRLERLFLASSSVAPATAVAGSAGTKRSGRENAAPGATVSGPWLRLLADVPDRIAAPGVSLRSLDDFTSEYLASVLASHGRKCAALKSARLATVLELLTTRESVELALRSTPPTSQAVFWRLVDHVNPMTFDQAGARYFAGFGHNRWGNYHAAASEIEPLARLGLVHGDSSQGVAWTWREVIRLFPERPNGVRFIAEDRRPARGEVPIALDTTTVPGVVAEAERLLRDWRLAPPTALNDGGLGVNPVRSSAKRLGLSAAQVGVLANFLVRRGLLTSLVSGMEGRGRNRRPVYGWAAPPIEAWDRASPAEQWGDIVAWWVEEPDLNEWAGAPERLFSDTAPDGAVFARSLFLRFLLHMEVGLGLDVEDLAVTLWRRYPAVFGPALVDGLVAIARCVGLVPADGPVGLTAGARLLLGARIGELDVAEDTTFVMQADHTIVAPLRLRRDIAATLGLLADLESEGGARVYRITEASVARALDGDKGADEIESFLRSYSAKTVPQAVVYFVHDVARRRGRLSIVEGSTVIVSDDPAIVLQAVRVAAARLHPLGAHAAMSALSAAKVEATLRAKGVLGVRVVAGPASPGGSGSSTGASGVGRPRQPGGRPTTGSALPRSNGTDAIAASGSQAFAVTLRRAVAHLDDARTRSLLRPTPLTDTR